MKLLFDQGLPRSAAHLLRLQGVDTLHVGEIGMSTAEDSAIEPAAVLLERLWGRRLWAKTLAQPLHARRERSSLPQS